MQKYRHFDRVSFFGEVDVHSHDGSVFLGRFWASDLSETGLFLQTTESFAKGQRIQLSLDLSVAGDNAGPLRIYDAEVSWVRPFEAVNVTGDPAGVGLHFYALSDVAHRRLQNFLQPSLKEHAVHDTLPPSSSLSDSGLLVSTPGPVAVDLISDVPSPPSADTLAGLSLDATAQELPESGKFAEIYTSLPPFRTDPLSPALEGPAPSTEFSSELTSEPAFTGTQLPSLRPLSLPPMQSAPIGPDDTLNDFASDFANDFSAANVPSSAGNAALALPVSDEMQAPSVSVSDSKRPRPTLVPAPRLEFGTDAMDLDATAQEIPSRKTGSKAAKMQPAFNKASVNEVSANNAQNLLGDLDATAQEIPSQKPLFVDAKLSFSSQKEAPLPKAALRTAKSDVNAERDQNLSSIPAVQKDMSQWSFRVVQRARPLPQAQNSEDQEADVLPSDMTSLNAKHSTEETSLLPVAASSIPSSWSHAQAGGHADALLDALHSEEDAPVSLDSSENSFSGLWFANAEHEAEAFAKRASNGVFADAKTSIFRGNGAEEADELDQTAAEILAGVRSLSSLSALPQLSELDSEEAFKNDSLTGLNLSHVDDLSNSNLAFTPLDSSFEPSEAYRLGDEFAEHFIADDSCSDATPLSRAGETQIPSSLPLQAPKWKGALYTVLFLGLGAAFGISLALYEDVPVKETLLSVTEGENASGVLVENTAARPVILSVADAESGLNNAQEDAVAAEASLRKSVAASNQAASLVAAKSTVGKTALAPQSEKNKEQKLAQAAAAVAIVKAQRTASKTDKSPASSVQSAVNLPLIEQNRVTVALAGGKVVKQFGLENPARVVVDLEGAAFPKKRSIEVGQKGIAKLRFGRPVAGRIRVVVELNSGKAPRNISVLKKADSLAVAWQ